MALPVTLALAAAVATAPAPQVVRGPIVTKPQARSALVAWTFDRPVRGDLVVDGRHFRTHTGRSHVIRVSGLTRGARHRYSLYARGRLVARGSFRTSPAANESFTAVVYGDYGTGADPQRLVARTAANITPDLFVSTGDNVYPMATRETVDANGLRPMRPLLRRAVFVPSLGNHDHWLDGGAAFLAAVELPGTEHWFVQRYGPAVFIVLDSNLAVSPDSAQGRFLARALKDTAGACPRFAVFHHPAYWPHSTTHGEEVARDVVPLLERAGVLAVLAGHVHGYDRSVVRNGLVHLTIGTGGNGPGTYEPPSLDSVKRISGELGYLRLDVGPRRTLARFVTPDGRVLDRFALSCP